MRTELIRPISVRVERPLYELLNGLSSAVDLPVGKLIRLAVIDYVGRLESGLVNLPRLGESGLNQEGVGGVIKRYRMASGSRASVEGGLASGRGEGIMERLSAIEKRLDRLEEGFSKGK